MNDWTVSSNTASAVVEALGGGIAINGGQLDLTDTTFAGNIAVGGSTPPCTSYFNCDKGGDATGGGVYVNAAGPMTWTGVDFDAIYSVVGGMVAHSCRSERIKAIAVGSLLTVTGMVARHHLDIARQAS